MDLPQFKKGDLPVTSKDIADKKFGDLVKKVEKALATYDRAIFAAETAATGLHQSSGDVGLFAQDRLNDRKNPVTGKEKTAYEAAFKASAALMQKLQG